MDTINTNLQIDQIEDKKNSLISLVLLIILTLILLIAGGYAIWVFYQKSQDSLPNQQTNIIKPVKEEPTITPILTQPASLEEAEALSVDVNEIDQEFKQIDEDLNQL